MLLKIIDSIEKKGLMIKKKKKRSKKKKNGKNQKNGLSTGYKSLEGNFWKNFGNSNARPVS